MACDIQEVVNTLIGLGLPDSHVVAALDKGHDPCLKTALSELSTVMSKAQLLRVTDELAYAARDAMDEAEEATPSHAEASMFYYQILTSGRQQLADAIHVVLKEE